MSTGTIINAFRQTLLCFSLAAILMTVPGCYWAGEVIECAEDSDCESGNICEGIVCILGCREDPDCGSGNICEGLVCVAGCREDFDCGNGSICEGSVCITGCREDFDCGSGNICEGIVCIAGCREDFDCGSGNICEGIVCIAGCREDPECGTGNICEGNVCIEGCRDDTDCGSGNICEVVCITGCREAKDCGSGNICEGKVCIAGCQEAKDCGFGNICDHGCMNIVPEGAFWMGCNSAVDSQCTSDESPYHEVMLSGYYMDRTEVTQGEYQKCIYAGECDTPSFRWTPASTPHHPVVTIDWTQASNYCAWAGKRLPTEAEWEKAARGTDGRKYPWGNEPATCEYAAMTGCHGDAMDVCSKSPAGDSPYGLCDMAGNVSEWVSDWYDSEYYTNSSGSNPTGPVSGSERVERGGGFEYELDGSVRASRRSYGPPSYDYDGSLGFRCARSQ